MRNTGFKIAFALLVLSFIADLISTFRLGALAHHLEANPLYKYGGFFTLIMLNLIFMAYLYWSYNKSKSPGWRFVLISFIVMVVLVRILVVGNNIDVGNAPPTMEQAQQITTEQKNKWFIMSIIPLFMPIFPAWTIYLLWKEDHIILIRRRK